MHDVLYRLTLEGVSALVMNSNAVLINGGEDKGRDPAAYEREHFRDKAYHDGGRLVIPARAVKKSLIEACKFLPEKPKGVAFKSYGPFIAAATIVPNDAEIIGATLDDLRPLTLVVNLDPSKGNKGPRGARTRPMLPAPWRATVDLIVFDPILTSDVLGRIAERAGKQVGILDGRAIDFGRCLINVAAARAVVAA